jgi:type I restriction enzyme, S subunit
MTDTTDNGHHSAQSMWARVEIGEIAKIVAGGTPPSKDPSCFAPPGEGTAWLTPADLSGYQCMYIERGARDLTSSGMSACSARLMPKGTVLFSSRAPIGYVAIAANDIATNQGFKSFVFPSDIDSRFAYYQLRMLKPVAEAMATGTTFKELSGSVAAKLPFKVAPVAEQSRIADKLDTVVARVAALNDRFTRVAPLLKRFRRSVLAAAMSGRLTEAWRLDQAPAPDAVREYQAPSEFSDLELPSTWTWLPVSKIATKVTDGVHKKPVYVASGVPFLTVSNLTAGQGVDFKNTRFITAEDHAEFSKRTRPERGDILISKDGTLGVVRLVETDQEFSIFVSVALVKPANKDHSKYLSLAFASPILQVQMKGVGTGIQHIHLTDLRKDLVPMPPLAEQAEIVRRVELLFGYADRLEARLQTAQVAAERLTPALLAKAFRGDLVPQDPNDEPASELLRRLRADATPVTAKRGRRNVA